MVKRLKLADYCSQEFGTRILSCGEGSQIGHPGREVTRKARAIDTFEGVDSVEEMKFRQIAAGGVHSLVLTEEGIIYSCGVNEKGTVPVRGLEAEGSTQCFTPIDFPKAIKQLGKPVQICAGASFSAALTAQGCVIGWGNLRDMQGCMSTHDKLREMQKGPVVIVGKESAPVVKIAAGENHLVMLSSEGEILTFGDGSMGQLGRARDTQRLRSSRMVNERSLKVVTPPRTTRRRTVGGSRVREYPHFVDVFAGGYWTMGRTSTGEIYSWGLNNFGQLGVKRDHHKQNGSTHENGQLPNGTSTPAEEEADNAGSDEITRVCEPTPAVEFPSTKAWKFIAGTQHVVCADDEGNVFAMGKNTDNALGLGTWRGNADKEHWRYDSLQQVRLPAAGEEEDAGELAAGADASMGGSMVWTRKGNVYSFGYDTVGQLGLGIVDEDEKEVATPQRLRSAHLEGYRVLSVSIADNHTLFLASNTPVPAAEEEE